MENIPMQLNWKKSALRKLFWSKKYEKGGDARKFHRNDHCFFQTTSVDGRHWQVASSWCLFWSCTLELSVGPWRIATKPAENRRKRAWISLDASFGIPSDGYDKRNGEGGTIKTERIRFDYMRRSIVSAIWIRLFSGLERHDKRESTQIFRRLLPYLNVSIQADETPIISLVSIVGPTCFSMMWVGVLHVVR